jgi:hypothetical protein
MGDGERGEPGFLEAPEGGAAPGAPSGPGTGRRRGRVRPAVSIGIVAALLVAGGSALCVARRPRDPAVAGSVPGGQVLAPLAPARDAGTGEEVAPFSGFAVSVETDPPGAVVTVAGIRRGESPAFAGVTCEPGEGVLVRAEMKRRAPAEVETTCRADALVKLRLRLAPLRP